jgi:D-alanyl-D-alanine carboxypeptidase
MDVFYMKRLVLLVCTTLLFFLQGNQEASAQGTADPDINSKAAVLMDSKSGAVLFTKNGDKKMYPASLTKMATAIYAIEHGNLDDTVTVGENALKVEGTRVYLNEGEKVPLKKLLQGMLINSGNDAAVAIAEHLDGNLKQFSDSLNQYLKDELQTKNTHFVNPHGLFSKDHYTTAKDLGLILNHAMQNREFKEIFSTKELPWKGESWETTIYSHHRMVKGEVPYEWVTGGKTGFVDQSKQTLATTASNGKIDLTAIVLKNDFKREIYKDTINLLDFGFTHYQTVPLAHTEVFIHAGKSFRPVEDVYVTQPLKEGMRKVDSSGLLSIRNSSGETVQELQLEEIVNEHQIEPAQEISETADESGLLQGNPLFITVVVFAAMAVWTLNRNLRRSRRKRHPLR